ncbi:MAG: hypothetical protein NTW30_00450 [Candidatus Aenigmarchaeota archaeon]|nr:hypothetical protein [Candidatus Aenigmarchaeota archaeon]
MHAIGLDLEKKKDPNYRKKFEEAFNLYFTVKQYNPNIFYLSHTQNRMLECSKKRW